MEIFTQVLINSTISGIVLALVAYGFGLIFNVLKVFHIAHGAVYVSGGYIFLWTHFILGHNLLISVLYTIIFTVLLSFLIERLVYKPLSNKGSGQAITLIASMGIYIVVINLIALFFGNESKVAQYSEVSSLDFYGVLLTPIQLIQFAIASCLLLLVFSLSKSKYFLRVRAVISNQQVASIMGINSNLIRLVAITIGSILAVSACILKFYDTGLDPYSGMGITLTSAVVVIIAGGFSLTGIISVSLLLSFILALTEWFLSAQWKEGITFIILLIIIIWKTEGIISYKMRIEES